LTCQNRVPDSLWGILTCRNDPRESRRVVSGKQNLKTGRPRHVLTCQNETREGGWTDFRLSKRRVGAPERDFDMSKWVGGQAERDFDKTKTGGGSGTPVFYGGTISTAIPRRSCRIVTPSRATFAQRTQCTKAVKLDVADRPCEPRTLHYPTSAS